MREQRQIHAEEGGGAKETQTEGSVALPQCLQKPTLTTYSMTSLGAEG